MRKKKRKTNKEKTKQMKVEVNNGNKTFIIIIS